MDKTTMIVILSLAVVIAFYVVIEAVNINLCTILGCC